MAEVNPILNLPQCCYRISVKAVIRDEQGRVLVIKEGSDDHWDLPGGGMDHGETVEQALARELQEEIGLTVKTATLAAAYPFMAGNGVWATWLLFETTVVDLDIALGDATDSTWLAPGNIGHPPIEQSLQLLTKHA